MIKEFVFSKLQQIKKSNCQIVQEFQIRDTVIKSHIADSEHKFDCAYLGHVSIKIVTNIEWRCNLS